MTNVFGFLEKERKNPPYRDVKDRVKDYKEVATQLSKDELKEQAERCMNCGIPFCHSYGCPITNLIPEWNDAVYNGQWKEAYERLEITNNFPEFTGRICPAPCETACTLAINTDSVTIRELELNIIEDAFANGLVVPHPPKVLTGKMVAIIGGGPAGLAAAQQLRRSGHEVTIFEKSTKVGGLLRFGIPDFKLEKSVIDRRLQILKAEGIEFENGVEIGKDISVSYLRNKYDAILVTAGAGQPRNLPVEGRDLEGVHFAMDFLSQSNKFVSGELDKLLIDAKDKNVLVIGGGDTGSDCVGTSIRQGAKNVYQIEIMPKPMEWNKPHNPDWPDWPRILRTSSSHLEGCDRSWNVTTDKFSGENGRLNKAHLSNIEWKASESGGRPDMVKLDSYELDVDLVFLAMGFVHTEHGVFTDQLCSEGVKLDERGNIAVTDFKATDDGIFAAGDAITGASLVVRAIGSGREAAYEVHQYLTK
ncbi:glutamate synthase subunit beta [Thiospirochaeta perfilievii]|uniref:Glutamate synthase subunit beta n=1 Tax=Thiospirochaeta perfilievii TaxID=252967 RepID=A0A5C1QEN7_9SPIO|nr:glutamate synthase subunit beta [Thiospirochaeta perfilievii]QEN06041.1 glutamate synthase subunit beta [Thiospirochaeta perfilievii]